MIFESSSVILSPLPEDPQDQTQRVSRAGKALCSVTSYLALLAPPTPHSGSCNCQCPDALISHAPGALVHAVLLPECPCSWPAPRLGSGVISFRLSLACPGQSFLLVFTSLYSNYLGPHQPAQSRTIGTIACLPCKPSTWHSCSINVSLKGTQTELGDT